jgi:hypothetical protein
MLKLSFLAAIMFSLVNGAWLMRRMQNAHRSVWLGLGQPTASLSTGVRPRLALVKYIWSLRFRELNDLPLSLACWMAISAEMLLAAILLVLILGAA